MAELNGKYKEDFNEIRKYIEKTAAKSSEREEALESLSVIYREAQEHHTELLKIHEGTAKDYAKEIAESLPKKKKPNFAKIAGTSTVFSVIVMVAIFLLINMSDAYLLQKRGFNHVLSSENEYEILVELQEHGVISYIDEKYEIHNEPASKSELFVTEKGIIEKGLIIRHLVLPNHLENSKKVLEWIKNNFGKEILVSVMAQYFPSNKASEENDINRKLTKEEYLEIENYVFELDLDGYMQDLEDNEEQYVPDFEKNED